MKGNFFFFGTMLEASLSLPVLLLLSLSELLIDIRRRLKDRFLGALIPTKFAVRLMRS
jgi:hypothetical protein